MKNTFGQSLTVTLFGESHGPAVGALIDGIAPGVEVNRAAIEKVLSRRRPSLSTDTQRVETDPFEILSGVFNDKTTGTPICISVPNQNTKSRDYNYGPARPAHADYSAFIKYHGFEDFRGGGHFSGRITTGLCAVGGILLPALEKKGIYIGTHILSCGEAKDRAFGDMIADIKSLQDMQFPVLDKEKEVAIIEEINKAREDQDSIGGVVQTAIAGLPAGVGEPWFDSIESLISHIVFSLGGVKGIEFGAGFEFAKMRGSQANDPIRIVDGKVVTETNNNAGINGGISNGMPVVFQTAVKPTPSISKVQKTVNFKSMENEDLEIHGRHDPSILRRICPVIDSCVAIVIADLLTQRFGTDFLA